MTEQEWLTGNDPQAMLTLLNGQAPACGAPSPLKPSSRKLRLFACALFRSRWKYLGSKMRASVVAVEDGTWDGEHNGWQITEPAEQFYATLLRDICSGVNAAKEKYGEDGMAYAEQANLLRDIVGNPFRPAVLLQVKRDCPVCDGRRWHRLVPTNPYSDRPCQRCHALGHVLECPWFTPTVLALARVAYEERPGRKCPDCKGRGKLTWPVQRGDGEFEADCQRCHGTGRIEDGSLDPVRMAILADALEEAGCTSTELMLHLRSLDWNARPVAAHVRGCWALDLLLLGKD